MLFAMAGTRRNPRRATPGETIPPDPYQAFLSLISSTAVRPSRPQQPLVYRQPESRAPTDRPAEVHPDLNLAIRGYAVTSGHLGLVNYGGDSPLAPQIDGMFGPPRLPGFKTLFQVYDWDWACNPPDGCAAPDLDYPVTLLEMTTTPARPSASAAIRRSTRRATGRWCSAPERRLTITYTAA